MLINLFLLKYTQLLSFSSLRTTYDRPYIKLLCISVWPKLVLFNSKKLNMPINSSKWPECFQHLLRLERPKINIL